MLDGEISAPSVLPLICILKNSARSFSGGRPECSLTKGPPNRNVYSDLAVVLFSNSVHNLSIVIHPCT